MIKGTRTEKNLLTAFAGESQARNRYTIYSGKAIEEGYEAIAAYFIETAEQEKVHARQLFSLLEGGELEITATFPAGVVGSTIENLMAAAAGEKYEHAIMYPEFAKIAREESLEKAARLFEAIAKAEMYHEERYLALAGNIRDGKVFHRDQPAIWYCRECGYIHEGVEAPKVCPACYKKQAYFDLARKAW